MNLTATVYANVEKKLQSLEGINSASVSLASRTALVDYDPDIISLEDKAESIKFLGVNRWASYKKI